MPGYFRRGIAVYQADTSGQRRIVPNGPLQPLYAVRTDSVVSAFFQVKGAGRKEQDVAGDFRPGVGFESVVGQADRAQQDVFQIRLAAVSSLYVICASVVQK